MRIFRSYPNHPSSGIENNFGSNKNAPLFRPNLKDMFKTNFLSAKGNMLMKNSHKKNDDTPKFEGFHGFEGLPRENDDE